MDDETRSLVSKRASKRCEYCKLHEDDDVYTFHVEHIVAIKHDDWTEHFTFQGSHVIGLTPRGRATVRVLDMNDPDRVRVRAELGFPDQHQ